MTMSYEQPKTLTTIPINKTREDITFPLSNITTNKKLKDVKNIARMEQYNLAKYLTVSDISYIDYTLGGTNGHVLEPVNGLFSDNIIIYFYLPDRVYENPKIIKYIKKEHAEDEDEKDNKLCSIVKVYLPEHTAKIVEMFNTAGLAINKTNVKPTGVKLVTARTNKGYKGMELQQRIKVDLANVSYASVIRYVSNIDNLKRLNKEGLFIGDIDFTQDFKGLFDKDKLIKYMLSIDYRLQGKKLKKDLEDYKATILDNNQHVSRNCLTFITKTRIGTTRYKIYNKFVQSTESPSVRGKIGHHIKDWINNPEAVLQEAIPKCLETGLLRLEITFYRTPDKQTITNEEINEEMETLKSVLVPEQLYYNSISNQWNLLCERVNNNIVIVDTQNNIAFILIYQNRLTSKINGFYVEDMHKLNDIIKDFTWNVPITVILYSKIENLISIQQDTYIKSKTDKTLLAKGCDNFKVALLRPDKHKGQTLKQAQDVGLLGNSKVNLYMPDRTWKPTNSVVFAQIDTIKLDYPIEETLREQNRDIKEAETDSTFQQKHHDKIKKLEEVNATINKEAEIARHKLAIKRIIDTALSAYGKTQKFKDIQDKRHMFVYGFKYVEIPSYGQACVLIYSWDVELKDDSILSPIYATANVKAYLEKLKGNYICTKGAGREWYALYKRSPMVVLEKDGFYYNHSNNKCPSVQIITVNREAKPVITKETVEQQHRMQEIPLSIKIKDCLKVEDLQEGIILEVRGYAPHRTSIIVNLSGSYYIATHWLKDLLTTHKTDVTFNVISGPLKTTPTRNKCRTFEMGKIESIDVPPLPPRKLTEEQKEKEHKHAENEKMEADKHKHAIKHRIDIDLNSNPKTTDEDIVE